MILVRRFPSRIREVKSSKACSTFISVINASIEDADWEILSEVLRFLSWTCIGQPQTKIGLLHAGLFRILCERIIVGLAGDISLPSVSDASPSLVKSEQHSVVTLKSIELLSQLITGCNLSESTLPILPADLAELEPILLSFTFTTDPHTNSRLYASASSLLHILGYESTALCYSKLATPPSKSEYIMCRQCLWVVCPSCRDQCHQGHAMGQVSLNFSGSCECSKSVCRIRTLSKTGSFMFSSSPSPLPLSSATPPLKPEPECSICCAGPPDMLLYPCGHIATCRTCATALFQAGRSCPICSTPIQDIVKVYRAT